MDKYFLSLYTDTLTHFVMCQQFKYFVLHIWLGRVNHSSVEDADGVCVYLGFEISGCDLSLEISISIIHALFTQHVP